MSFFTNWALQHAKIFGLNDAEMATILSWELLFEAADYTGAELHAATDEIARNVGAIDVFRDKMPGHLQAIQDAIRRMRTVTSARDTEASFDAGECTLCQNTGFVIVPRLEGVKDCQWMPQPSPGGRGTYYTYAVLCSCARGRFKNLGIHEKTKKPRVMLTLEEYANKNPHWKAQLAQRALEQKEQAKLGPPPPYAEVSKRLAARFSMPREPVDRRSGTDILKLPGR